MKHLWECDHPYYASESNFYSREPYQNYDSWDNFFSVNGDADMDYNAIFRFDWKEGEDNGGGEYSGDDYYRNGILQIIWIRQRKGVYACDEISVCRADEPRVIKFLKPRFAHVMKLWEPISVAETGA